MARVLLASRLLPACFPVLRLCSVVPHPYGVGKGPQSNPRAGNRRATTEQNRRASFDDQTESILAIGELAYDPHDKISIDH